MESKYDPQNQHQRNMAGGNGNVLLKEVHDNVLNQVHIIESLKYFEKQVFTTR